MMKTMIVKGFLAGLIMAGSFLSKNAIAADAGCPDAQVLSGKLVEDVCWSCMFPIKVAGMSFGGGSAAGGSVTSSFCACEDSLGLMRPGIVGAMWEPARLVEIVKGHGCAPSLGGIRLPLSDIARQGELFTETVNHAESEAPGSLHYHYYAFPLTVMLEMMIDGSCNKDGFSDFDLMYFSEIDATWNHEELAFFTHPEASIVASPPMQMACVADAAASTFFNPIEQLFWCAGTWGNIYPFSGNFTGNASAAVNQNLLAVRAMAMLHRRGLAWKTIGEGSLCNAQIYPSLPKRQYKLNYFFPEAEADESHQIGEQDFAWGAGRVIPGTGEDAVLMIFRWNDCCVLF
jgi:conjugal transfer pilus assembly protein TraU